MGARCTVLVPSFNRIPSVLELLDRLRSQDYTDLEILIVEQSTRASEEDMERLRAVVEEDPRIRMEQHPPLGVGGARNVGMEAATGEVVLIIDDDDLPATDDWVSRHMASYGDSHCIAVHGGEDREDGGGGGFERRFPRLAYRMCMTYGPLGTPIALPAVRRRKRGTKFLRGGNSSIRRAWALKAGGWVDECGNGQEEHDFSFRLRKLMGRDDYILFEPTARIIRRMDIPGGADRRTGTMAHEVEGNVRFYFRVIARHQPLRVLLLLPLYPLVIFWRSVGWILDDRGHEPVHRQGAALFHLLLTFPFLLVRALARLGSPPPQPGP